MADMLSAIPTANPAAPVTSYDEVPYDSHPFAQTHPSRLFTVGTLFGLRPTPVQRCRVLELACAAGGNRSRLRSSAAFAKARARPLPSGRSRN